MNYIAIENCELNNGIGVGTTLYVSGCSHFCRGCFNPETWDDQKGQPVTSDTYIAILETVKAYHAQRLTISGGDPLFVGNWLGLIDLLETIKPQLHGVSIWLYTGYKLEEILNLDKKLVQCLVKNVNYIVDGKYDCKTTHTLPFRGSDNQRIWHNVDGVFVKVLSGENNGN